MIYLKPEVEEFFSVVRSAVKVTYEHIDGYSYSFFAPKHAADHYEKNLRETNSPTTLQDYVIQQYADDPFKSLDPETTQLLKILYWKNGVVELDFNLKEQGSCGVKLFLKKD